MNGIDQPLTEVGKRNLNEFNHETYKELVGFVVKALFLNSLFFAINYSPATSRSYPGE
jgi:hypothetical protein